MELVRVGIAGTGFVADIHAQALSRIPGVEVAAVVSSRTARAEEFAAKFRIPKVCVDYRELLEVRDLDVVSLCIPNHLHCEYTVAAAAAGKHVICEKPLCLNLAEADRMIDACRKAGVHLMYAEELCFAPKYVRAKQLVDEGALGKVYLVKQSEKHAGPHADWFWQVETSGGGVLMDMGCHGVEFARWVLGRPKAVAVTAHCGTYVHGDRTRGDDTAVILVEFENHALGLIEESWAKPGGMDDRAEIFGSHGATYADLLHGSSLLTYSDIGYGYAVEKAGPTRGWTFTMFEELWNYGFPQEMEHFVKCVRGEAIPEVTGEDGRAVLEVLFAAYESAASGRRIELPFVSDDRIPIAPWLRRNESTDA